jgi:carboxypeptidase C (cathepsin A)
MSGGHYEYRYNRLNDLADDIERDFLNDGIVKSEYEKSGTYDYLSDATAKQRIIILKEVKKLIKDLRKCAGRTKALEWYTSGDFGAESYLGAIKKI